MRGPVGPLSKFRNRSLLVALSGGVKELRAFPAILHLSLTPRPTKPAQKYELFHGTCIELGPTPPCRYPAELMSITARGQPEILQVGRAFGRQPIGVRHKWADFYPEDVRSAPYLNVTVTAECSPKSRRAL